MNRTIVKEHIPKKHLDFENPIQTDKVFDNTSNRIYGEYWNYEDVSEQFTLAEASQAPDTNVRISGDRERDITSPVCPVNDVVCCPVSMSQRALQE